MTADLSEEFSLMLCYLWNWEQGIEADAELCMQGHLLVQAVLCAVLVSQTVGIFGWMALYRHAAVCMKTQAAPFLFKGFQEQWIQKSLAESQHSYGWHHHHWNAFMLMWGMSFMLSNLKGRASAQLPCCSCVPEVSFVTQNLPGDLAIQTKQSMSWLWLQLIMKVAVVGNWLGEN